MYEKKMTVRWNDLDANRHMANSAYIQMGANARMGFFTEQGLSLSQLHQKQIGPVVFQEQVFYFQEAFLDDPLRITVQLSGLSEGGRFFSIQQDFYNRAGDNLARIFIMGGFIQQQTRKITVLDHADYENLKMAAKTPDFKTLESKDTRVWGQYPIPSKPF